MRPNDLPAPARLRRTRLVAAIALFLTGVGTLKTGAVNAQQLSPPTQAELDAAIREGLKLDKSLPTPGILIGRPPKLGPRVISADRIDGVNDKSVSAEGNVSLKQGNMALSAERLDYDEATDTATAPGRVSMNREGDVVTGNDLKLKVEAEIGRMGDPTFFFSKSPDRPSQRYEARGAAKRMDFEGPEQERLYDAFYTTCKLDESDWYLRVSELSLDRTRNIGTGINAYVEFKGVPILYMPYMTFPLNSDRKSGFLAPTIGSSSSSGIEVAVPYYWNISPNIDATLTPKIFTRRGLQLGTEVRYLNRDFLGQFDTEYLPDDRLAERDRYLASLRHYQNLDRWLAPGWNASINAQKVSDDNYFRDLSTRINNTAQTFLPRDVSLSYASDYGNLTSRFLSFQTLQDSTADLIVAPYKLSPQITFNARPNRWNGIELNTIGEFTAFEHPTLVSGRRWLVYPSLSYPIVRPYGFITPKIGFHATRYDLTGNTKNFEGGTRTLPILSVDSGLAFERAATLFGQSITQTLEPRLFFLHVPYRDQSKLPLFSTSETDFSFAQIFNENLFVGGDRISDARQITAAVTTRFIENITGVERLRASIGQRYYLSPQRVTLATNEAIGISGTPSGDISRSDFLAALSGQVSDHWTLDSGFQYSASTKQFQKTNVSARYHAEGGRLLNFSYRFTRESLKQIDISTQWPFGRTAPAWTLLARANYSLRDVRLIEGLLGVEYNQGCWEFRLVAHRFATAAEKYSNSIKFQLELKGLSKLGVNPLETLRQNISGYRRSDDRAGDQYGR
ncbi:MAG: LPS-assembly protein LptD [Burkholderiales bacterium]|nr:LPS-assembly protein LptD [Burkholderiales bacterium]